MERSKRSNIPSILLLAAIVGVATYVMTRNPDHRVGVGSYDSHITEYDSVEIAPDTTVAHRAPRSSDATKPATRRAPVRDLLSEEIPTE